MSTFVLNLNDTIVLSDSVVVKVTKTADACLTSINEVATNWADVEIVRQICCSFITIACIFVIGYILVRVIGIISAYYSEERKRMWEMEDRDNKREAELFDKLLNFEEKRATSYLVNEKGEWIDKDKNLLVEDIKAINDYISLLNGLLKKQNSEQNETENKPNS